MGKFLQFIKESASDGIANELEKLGLKKNKDRDNSYHANHHPEVIHNVLTKHGYRMITHYKSTGNPFPKHEVYEKETPYATHKVELNYHNNGVKHDKVQHVHFVSHTSG
jgi:hypothetical protein